MKIRIHKYHINDPEQILRFPRGAKITCAAFQRSKLCLWVQFDTTSDDYPADDEHRVWVVPTGVAVTIPFDAALVGVALDDDLGLVFHVYAKRV